jgi:uncharacterized membrane protein YfcA
MDALTLLANGAALVMGITLGLLGGGGSILTVPILVYLLGIPPTQATGWSLLVAELTAGVGAFGPLRAGLVPLRTAALFAGPSIGAIFLTRRLLLPALPETLLEIGDWVLTKDLALMLLFAVVMVLAAWRMIRPSPLPADSLPGSPDALRLGLQGAATGLVAGLVGAGGGFLIVPALVLLAGLPMKTAVGTSLLIIALQSFIGFLGDLGTGAAVNWSLLLPLVVCALAGVLIGSRLARQVSAAGLKVAFGWFVLVMGCLIVLAETL